MSIGRSACATLLLVVLALGACGSDSGGSGGSGTHLTIDGAAATGFSAPDPEDPTLADPDNVIEIDISGEITCDGANATGTGVYELSAPDLCQQITAQSGLLETLTNEDPDDLLCTEIYGGPQHASIEGTVDGIPVDIDVKRNDGCGIDTWQQLEWLLGPPER